MTEQKSPRKDITGAQAKALARLALVGIVERTIIAPRELCVRFATVYVAGHPRSNVFIRRNGGMASSLPHDHPVRGKIILAKRITKIVPAHLRECSFDALEQIRPDIAAEVSRIYEQTGVAA